MYTILTKTRKTLHHCNHNVRMLIVTYFIAACFKVILVAAPCRWQDNTETWRSYVQHSMHKLQTSAFAYAGVT